MSTTTQATLMADRLRGQGETRITQRLNDSISRAFLLTDQRIALDFNARLITALHDQDIWPSRYVEPQDWPTP